MSITQFHNRMLHYTQVQNPSGTGIAQTIALRTEERKYPIGMRPTTVQTTPTRGIRERIFWGDAMTPNQDYLVPYRTAFLLYIPIRLTITWTAFTTGTISCKGTYKSGSDKSRKLFPYITMIAINGRVRLPSCRPDFALLVLLDSIHVCRPSSC